MNLDSGRWDTTVFLLGFELRVLAFVIYKD